MRSWMQPWFKDDDHTLDYEPNKKIDMISGRYNVPKSVNPTSVVLDSIIGSNASGISIEFVSTKHGSIVRDAFCDHLLDYVNKPMGANLYTGVHLTTSGALAVEDAIKIAMQAKEGARTVIAFEKSYHGATFGAGSCTGEERRKYVENSTIGFCHARNPSVSSVDAINDVRAIIEQKGEENVACIVLEVVNTIHGLLYGNSDFFSDLQLLCTKHKIMLIVDEVLTGFYRTGKRFAFMHYGLHPDMICFSKAVTNGQVPLGGVILHSLVRQKFRDKVFGVGSTYSGYPFGCAVGIQSVTWLKLVEPTANNLEQEMYDAWKYLVSNGVSARQFGLLMSIKFETAEKARIFKQLLQSFIVDQHDENVIIAPPFDLAPGMFTHFAEMVRNNFEKVQKSV